MWIGAHVSAYSAIQAIPEANIVDKIISSLSPAGKYLFAYKQSSGFH